MLIEAGVKLRLYTFVSDVICEDEEVKGLIVETKPGTWCNLCKDDRRLQW